MQPIVAEPETIMPLAFIPVYVRVPSNNGPREVKITPEACRKLFNMRRDVNKVELIKQIRTRFDLGLKEAKDVADTMFLLSDVYQPVPTVDPQVLHSEIVDELVHTWL
jgi:hypothetical protein